MKYLWTVEWEKDYPEHNITANWCVVRSFSDALKITRKLGVNVTQVTAEEFAKANCCSIEEAKQYMLPVWSNEDDLVTITEYTEDSAGPIKWRMFNQWLESYAENLELDRNG